MKKIRKISIGVNPKDTLVYVVGGLHNRGTIVITDIIKEQAASIFRKNTKYYIYASYINNADNVFLWYEVENMPVMIQYYNEQYIQHETNP
jgi:hypothetical protein